MQIIYPQNQAFIPFYRKLIASMAQNMQYVIIPFALYPDVEK